MRGEQAAPREPLAAEVQRAVDRWKAEKFEWGIYANPTKGYDEFLGVDMARLQSADLSKWRKAAAANWQGVDRLPTLTGYYRRRRVAASDWPRARSMAIEFTPRMQADPDQPGKPWRMVLLFATATENTAYARQAVADQGTQDEENTVFFGQKDGQIPAVPVDRQEAQGVVTYYCICPARATLDVAGVKLIQYAPEVPAPVGPAAQSHAEWKDKRDVFMYGVRERDRAAPTAEQRQQIEADVRAWQIANPEPGQEVHDRWQALHDEFLSRTKQRASAATTDEQKRQIQADIAAWKAANPEPPQADAANTATSNSPPR